MPKKNEQQQLAARLLRDAVRDERSVRRALHAAPPQARPSLKATWRDTQRALRAAERFDQEASGELRTADTVDPALAGALAKASGT